MTTELWFPMSLITVIGLSIWAATESRGGIRFAIVIWTVAVVIGLPYVVLADSFEASTLPEHDATMRNYAVALGLLAFLDLGVLVGRWRRGRRGNDGTSE
jgi:hypothetical protein